MYIDKLDNMTGAHSSVNNDRIKNKEKIDSKKSSISDKNPKVESKNSEMLQFSSEAKQLQESESILRKALLKIETFEKERDSNISEIKRKIDSDFYDSDEFVENLSKKIFSDKDIQDFISEKKALNRISQKIKNRENSEELDTEKLDKISKKIDSDFYNDPEVISGTADKILDLLL